MVKNIKSVGVLVAICTVVALLLAVTNQFTAPIIEKNQSAAANQALLEVMPDGTGFEEMDLGSYNLPASVTKAYKETSGKGAQHEAVHGRYLLDNEHNGQDKADKGS